MQAAKQAMTKIDWNIFQQKIMRALYALTILQLHLISRVLLSIALIVHHLQFLICEGGYQISGHCASSHSFNLYFQNKNHTHLKNLYEHTKNCITKPSVSGHVELSNKTNVAFHFQIQAYWLFYLLCCRVCQKALLWRQVAMKRDKNFISARRHIALLCEKLHSSPMEKIIQMNEAWQKAEKSLQLP